MSDSPREQAARVAGGVLRSHAEVNGGELESVLTIYTPEGIGALVANALIEAGLLATNEERQLLDFWARMEARKATPDALKAMLARSLAREAVIDTAKAWAHPDTWPQDTHHLTVNLVAAVDALNAIEAKP